MTAIFIGNLHRFTQGSLSPPEPARRPGGAIGTGGRDHAPCQPFYPTVSRAFREGVCAWGSSADPLTFTAVSLLLVAVAAVASWAPARKAARLDPMILLRA